MPLKDVARASSVSRNGRFWCSTVRPGDVCQRPPRDRCRGELKLPDDAVLEARVLRTIGAEPTSQELGVIAHEGRCG